MITEVVLSLLLSIAFLYHAFQCKSSKSSTRYAVKSAGGAGVGVVVDVNHLSIGVLGSGRVGKVLAAGFHKKGHSVMIGTRNSTKMNSWQKGDGHGVIAASLQVVANSSDVLILAVQGNVALKVLEAISLHVKGKVIIDATNPILEDSEGKTKGGVPKASANR